MKKNYLLLLILLITSRLAVPAFPNQSHPGNTPGNPAASYNHNNQDCDMGHYGFNQMLHSNHGQYHMPDAYQEPVRQSRQDSQNMTQSRQKAQATNRSNSSSNTAAALNPESILDVAKKNDHKALERLLKQNIDVNYAKQNDKTTALIWATRKNHTDSVTMLLKYNAQVNCNDRAGMCGNPLGWAAFNGNVSMVELLISAGADINLPDNNGATPLIRAARQGKINVVMLLLDKNAHINLTDKNNDTALIWAQRNGHNEIAELIEQHDLKLNAAAAGTVNFIETECTSDNQENRRFDSVMSQVNQNRRTSTSRSSSVSSEGDIVTLHLNHKEVTNEAVAECALSTSQTHDNVENIISNAMNLAKNSSSSSTHHCPSHNDDFTTPSSNKADLSDFSFTPTGAESLSLKNYSVEQATQSTKLEEDDLAEFIKNLHPYATNSSNSNCE